MQHLTNTKEMLSTARDQVASPATPSLKWHRAKSDPARSWLRLDEATVSDTAAVRQEIDCQAQAALDVLRYRILRQVRKEGLKKLGFCGVNHGSGTTFLSSRLAYDLSRQVDLKVMLFDLNLRRPNQSNQFALAGTIPRQTALSGTRREFDSTCLRVGHNLALSLFSEGETHPSSILGTLRAKLLIQQIEREFEPDLMIFDLPPVLGSNEVIAAADLFDAALLIARADHTSVAQVDQAERLVSEQKPCLGVIMNAARFDPVFAGE